MKYKKYDYESKLSNLFAMNAKTEVILDEDQLATPHIKLVYVYVQSGGGPGQPLEPKMLHSLGVGESWQEALQSINFPWGVPEKYKKYWKE